MSQTLQSASVALRAVKLLRERGELGVTELSRELGVGASTAHRLLATLALEGFASPTSARRYVPGPEAGGNVGAIEHCAEVAGPIMRELREASGETVHLSVLRGREVLFLASVESKAQVRVSSRAGEHPPAHTTAAGKVLLGALSKAERDDTLGSVQLESRTERSLTDRRRLDRELEDAAISGRARNRGESEHDMYAVAMAIRRPGGSPVCALSLAAPLSRVLPRLDDALGPEERRLLGHLSSATRRLESLLAY